MQATPAVYHKEIARTHGALKAICIAFSSRLRPHIPNRAGTNQPFMQRGTACVQDQKKRARLGPLNSLMLDSQMALGLISQARASRPPATTRGAPCGRHHA